jgi:hypothetical protein
MGKPLGKLPHGTPKDEYMGKTETGLRETDFKGTNEVGSSFRTGPNEGVCHDLGET